jgi:hypothetical protein
VNIVEIEVGLRDARARKSTQLLFGEKVVHALLRYGFLIYFKKF